MTAHIEVAPAKLNLALHVRGKRPDGRHSIETIFAFCEAGDSVSVEPADALSLEATGPFAAELGGSDDNLALKAAHLLRERAEVEKGAAIRLDKILPVAAGLGGGSADAAATLRLLTAFWNIGPGHAQAVAPALGSDVPACLLGRAARGEGVGDQLTPIDADALAGMPVLLLNPRVPLSTGDVFARWDGFDRGPLGDWRKGRNDLEPAATAMVPQLALMLAWLSAQPKARFVRMSGSGATCFALFDSEQDRDDVEQAVPREWWRLSTRLR